MKLPILAVLSIMTSRVTPARIISQNVLASILQDILSPNGNNGMQYLQMANSGMPVAECGRGNECMPVRYDMPARANYDAMPRMATADLQPRMVANVANIDGNQARAMAGYESLPRVAANRQPMPGNAMAGYEQIPVTQERGPIQNIMPERYPIQNIMQNELAQTKRFTQSNIMNSLIMPREIYQSFPFAPVQESIISPCLTPPIANPYLPIASPISMTSAYPAPTQSRGQFLRKIPIPPPTL